MAGRYSTVLAALAAGAAMAAPASAAVSTSVDARSNVFAAGLGAVPAFAGGGGLLPPVVALDGAATITFGSVTGLWECANGSVPYYGPDGDCFSNSGDTNLNAWGSIAGIAADSEGPLVGVFLGPDAPSGAPPAKLDFRNSALGETFATLAPALRQPFYIGDGVGAPGVRQRFKVPAGATRLFLGMADGWNFNGSPGYYNDNSGAFNVSVDSLVSDCAATVFGTSGDDTRTLGSTDDAFDGLGGHDTVNAGSGDDCVLGGEGDDVVGGGSGNDQIDGGAGADTIDGGSGADRILGGAGADTISAGGGADRIDVRDGEGGDSVNCGGDFDRYRADPGDIVAADCEQASEIL